MEFWEAFRTFADGFISVFVQILCYATYLLVIGFLIYVIVLFCRRRAAKRKNDKAPYITTEASVLSRRTYIQGRYTMTYYFVTFVLSTGLRAEFEVTGNQFGRLMEGDTGKLTYQGTRFIRYQRRIR